MIFFIGLLVTASLFSVCLIICYIVLNTKKSKKITSPKNDDAKIFYITNFQKPKKKPKKLEPDIAIKGAIISPKEFHHLYTDTDTENYKN